ncbi:hypothetical protein DY000_02049110 [Brassica cretica]|uniref:Uncharacterized protein n=1 Tax=Brassica cretica TaxID=69181 RepID=A0ABQ7EPC0_BRACR|nr:hypothetical protein DY000_02049110 [Brassica cretica]
MEAQSLRSEMEKKVDVTNSEAMEAKLTRVKNGSFPRLRRMEVPSFHPWLQSVQRGVKYIIELEFGVDDNLYALVFRVIRNRNCA